MLSNLQQKIVWEGWLASEIRAYYFADLGYRYQQRQRVATWFTLVLSSGAVVTLLDWVPPQWRWIRLFLTAATAFISLWSLVAQRDKVAIDCSDLHFRWNKLAVEYRALWDDMYASNAAKRLSGLSETSAELSRSGSRVRNDAALMSKWQDYVVHHHASELPA